MTWYWIGPDTVHSVTGDSASHWESTPTPATTAATTTIGDSFQVSFDQAWRPTTFQCKLHASVRGTVTVSSTPGDPTAEPDPVPENNVDRTGPHLREIALDTKTVHRRGARLRFALNERSKVYADYYRIDRRGRREFAGYQLWRNRHIGYNDVRFGEPGDHFKAEHGRYEAKLWAADSLDNTSRKRKVRFEIRPH